MQAEFDGVYHNGTNPDIWSSVTPRGGQPVCLIPLPSIHSLPIYLHPPHAPVKNTNPEPTLRPQIALCGKPSRGNQFLYGAMAAGMWSRA